MAVYFESCDNYPFSPQHNRVAVYMQIQGVKGTQDILPPAGRIWRAIETLAADVHRRFGYEEVRTPILEHTELFHRSIGDETDIVSKEMYTFEDKGGRSVTMRPEGTAPLVRSIVQHKLLAQKNLHRLYYVGPMFRYERAQKGRLRQFHQIGAELYGQSSPLADAEIVSLQHVLFSELGVPGLALEINNLGTSASRAAFGQALREHLKANSATLCTDCIRRTETNPLRALDCKVPACAPVLDAAPGILEFADDESREHFDRFREQLERAGVPYVINPRIVRGLDYYTKVVFEFTSTGLGAKNTLSAGGRYDELIGGLGGPATPAVGYACGIERLLLLLGEGAATVARPLEKIYLIVLGDRAADAGAKLAGQLRRLELAVEEDLGRGSLKSQMKSANRAEATWSILLGGDEVEAGELTLRDMRDGAQTKLPLEASAVAAAIRGA